ncbi:hypothetical protein D3C79_757310 [compost metagenome]
MSNWPLFCGGLIGTVNWPFAPTSTVPTTLLFGSRTVMVVPASAVPVIDVPAGLSNRLSGCTGAVRSGAFTCRGADGLPVVSWAMTVRTSPLICGLFRLRTKVPSGSTVTWPSRSPLLLTTVTRVPASAVPTTWVPLSLMVAITVAGGVISTAVTVLTADTLALPSVRVTCSTWPLSCAASSSTTKVPSAPTVPVPTCVVPT